jgi:hypothetical protein
LRRSERHLHDDVDGIEPQSLRATSRPYLEGPPLAAPGPRKLPSGNDRVLGRRAKVDERNTLDPGPHSLAQIRKNAALLRRGEIVAQIKRCDEQCTRRPEPQAGQFLDIATRVYASTTLCARAAITAEARSPVRRLRLCGREER